MCGKGIPEWVNRMAFIATRLPFIEKHIPKKFLTPVSLEVIIREHIENQNNEPNVNRDNVSQKNNSQQSGNQQNDSQ